MVISNVSVWGRGECDSSSGREECELEVGANVNLVPLIMAGTFQSEYLHGVPQRSA